MKKTLLQVKKLHQLKDMRSAHEATRTVAPPVRKEGGGGGRMREWDA